ncbi:MAG TPA: response regulator [Acidimicrobiales bacterium]|nr:response regulator [Acidimicrobiales bacterium]
MPRILIVDDELQVRRVVGLAFELEGFDVASAADGAEGIAQVQLFHPDVVIMDIMMPRVDGLTALSHLRQQPASANVPILLLSAKADSADVAIGMRAGADDYVTKPFDLEDLLARATAAAAAGRRPAPAPNRAPPPTGTATSLAERPAPPRTPPPATERTAVPSAVMAGVAAFALLTLVIVAVGMALAWTGSAPPLWTGLVLETPAVLAGMAVARHSMRSGRGKVEVRGTGLGGRTITARACVCRSPADASNRLFPGDILVIDDPTPTYNAVGSLLGGLVVESGGFNSHAAILARQLGIPALVGATGACTRIRDGERITLDPVAGTASSS